jgi:hypothetical protein
MLEYPLNYNPQMLSESQLWKKAMYLEQKLQEYLGTDKYIGKNSRVAKITFECNVLWKALEALGRKDLANQRAEANRASLVVL